jgi:four helix bundle protein
MRDFKKIIAWQKAHALSVAMTGLVDGRRFRVRPKLRSQLLRAIDAIGAQISEGAGKPSTPEFARYLDMAMSTARETENHLLLARDIGCMDRQVADDCLERLDEVKRVLYAYTRAVRPATDD